MKMILLQDVKSIGKKGDLINASEGYAKNFLLPRKLAVEATKSNLNDYELNQKAEAVMISNGIALENYMSSQLEQNDFGDTTLILTFDQAAKEKVLEMEGAQNVEVLTDLTGDELEILDPYGAELVTYGICYETLSNTIHKLAELLNEENMEV